MTKMSTMLGLIFFSSLLYTQANADETNLTVNGKSVTVTAPACTDGADGTLAKNEYCIDKKGRLAVFVRVSTTNGILGTGVGNREKTSVVSRALTKKELIAFANGHLSGNLDKDKNKVCSDGSGCADVKDDAKTDNTTVVTNDDGRGRGRGDRDRGRGRGRGGRGGRGGSYSYDPVVDAQADLDDLKNFCGGLEDRIIDRDAAIKDIQAQIDALDIPGLQAEADAAYSKMLKGCRRDCIKLAITKDGACAIPADKLAELVSKEDLNDKLLGVDVYFGGQSKYIEYINGVSSVDGSKVCSKMLANAACKAEIIKSGLSDCEEGATWLVALKNLDDAKKTLADLKAKQSTYAKNTSTSGCTVSSAADVHSSKWDNCSADCLQRALDSCPKALAQAEYDLNVAYRTPYCPDCGVNGGGGAACAMYGNCGVSKAAQIIAALGGPVTAIAGGLMNMSMFNNSLAACTSMYSQQIQLSQVVGLPPTGPNCGGMGGMGGGFMGGMGMGGMGMGGMPGMYNPYGMGGMGMGFGMGMNPYGMGGMGMGMPGMYNPYGMGMGMPGMGLGLNVGLGMNPYGMGGMGMGMPGMGMGMGYPGYAGGMYYPGMGGGMGGGMYPGMGMGMVMGMGMGGGMYPGYNPMAQQMSMQNQMYNAQLQMQQNAYQQMAIQNSMMNGYNNAANMYGMNGMYQSPYFGMGAGTSYNPMAMYGNNYGYGNYYNPYGSMYGGGMPGFNAGINFNAGLNWY